MRQPTPAFVLWLIKKKVATTINQLCRFFGADRDDAHVRDEIRSQVGRLHAAELVAESLLSDELSTTDRLGRIQAALGFTVTDLAFHQRDGSLYVTPLFGKPTSTSCKRDIFVLMPFAPEMKPIYDDHLKDVAADLRMSIARADDFFSASAVMADIWAAIYHAKVVIADCTGKNANVFYEMGLAHTLGKPVIIITQNPDDVPFDVRHIRYIEYEPTTVKGAKDFARTLKETLTAIIADVNANDPKIVAATKVPRE